MCGIVHLKDEFSFNIKSQVQNQFVLLVLYMNQRVPPIDSHFFYEYLIKLLDKVF